MFGRNAPAYLALSSLTALLTGAIPTEDCPNSGPAFSSDFNIAETDAFKDAIAGMPEQIEALIAASQVSSNITTFSIDVFSTATNESVYNYHHAAPILNGTLTAGKLDDESIYRIGSVSKLFTAYAILNTADIAVFEHPVTQYLPELAGNKGPGKIIWEDVTVGALASQQAGVGGMPTEATTCLVQPTPGCPINDTASFLTFMRDQKRPVIKPWTNALYSDASWAVLGRVLERLTGQPYEDALQTALATPLGLNSSTTLEPSSEGLNAVRIPTTETDPSAWALDNLITAPSGGLYSNNADLRKLGLSILHSELLSGATTREWMKPRGNTGTLTTQIGAPWEINRLSIPVSPDTNRTRVSDLYTKLGGNPQYAAVFALSPDHGLGFSILTAGPNAVPARIPLRDTVATVFVTAAEHAAAENAERNFAGTFVDEAAQGTNLTLTVDSGRPGLGISSLYLNSTESRNLLLGNLEIAPANISTRLYPTGLEWTAADIAETNATAAASAIPDTKYLSYRAWSRVVPGEVRAEVEGGEGLFDHCDNWSEVDFVNEGGIGTDEFVLEVVGGKLKSVTSVFLGEVMTRVE